MSANPSIPPREAKKKINSLADQASAGATISVVSRGVEVAVLRPLPPGDLGNAEKVPLSSISSGKRNFTSVMIHGPYVLTRHGQPVAFLDKAKTAQSSSPEKELAEEVRGLTRAIRALGFLESAEQARIARIQMLGELEGEILGRIDSHLRRLGHFDIKDADEARAHLKKLMSTAQPGGQTRAERRPRRKIAMRVTNQEEELGPKVE